METRAGTGFGPSSTDTWLSQVLETSRYAVKTNYVSGMAIWESSWMNASRGTAWGGCVKHGTCKEAAVPLIGNAIVSRMDHARERESCVRLTLCTPKMYESGAN